MLVSQILNMKALTSGWLIQRCYAPIQTRDLISLQNRWIKLTTNVQRKIYRSNHLNGMKNGIAQYAEIGSKSRGMLPPMELCQISICTQRASLASPSVRLSFNKSPKALIVILQVLYALILKQLKQTKCLQELMKKLSLKS